MQQTGWRLAVKKTVDRSAALASLVVFSPVMAAAAVAIRATMGSPVLFRQPRPGLHERVFQAIKFRTMNAAVDDSGRPLPDGERLTPLGRWLRNTSIDELPQLWNVLRGDLSLVGPRPLLVDYLERYTQEEHRRHDVLPGITGLTAVRGRNALSWEDRFRFDLEYVDSWSLGLDAKILALTVWKVIRREGISYAGHPTMPNLRHWKERANGAQAREREPAR